ncbi:glucosamine-6-phosphate deaminase [Rhodopirellula sallentina]|uniref:Glucosamine-6-phosphate deaminase n=1 Tax=Rhodopirellula sallentina SM41 TaxID=1263870 RepID=M5TXJ6_9BACT|nr:glucosamine-6-phosphate deaminase [Rhodopirellula sallentina]EMI53910.1 glucosamine-6-phosphate deaminase [Rhodopirellula sallentina SM41]
MGIQCTVYPSHDDASRAVADCISTILREKPTCVLGLATGSTPLEVYAELVRRHHDTGLDFAGATTFNLDEYVGLSPGHPQSYAHYMNEHLFGQVNVDRGRTHLPNTRADDLGQSAEQYEMLVRSAGGVDLQLLGIGTNGHIGFNEPGTAEDSVTRVVDLAASTIRSNSRFFRDESDVPRRAITMGISTILRARKIVLLATGESKADAVADAVTGPVTTGNPASFLQNHADVHFVLDAAAAALLPERC